VDKPAGYVGLTNVSAADAELALTPVASGRVQFAATPLISSSLGAQVICPFVSRWATTARGVAVRAWTRPERAIDATLALEGAVRALDYFEAYFGLNYSLPKLDLGLCDGRNGKPVIHYDWRGRPADQHPGAQCGCSPSGSPGWHFTSSVTGGLAIV
jgi:hypothetical protein